MIQEAYVSYEVAKLLIKKGFNEPTLAYAYGQDMISYYSKPRVTDPMNIEAGRIPLPTLQMAMKWLREVYKLNIATYPTRQMELVVGKGFVRQYNCDIFNDNELVQSLKFITGYEQASEAAIKCCLENLI